MVVVIDGCDTLKIVVQFISKVVNVESIQIHKSVIKERFKKKRNLFLNLKMSTVLMR